MRIAMLGTRGAPARYGGFETAVEEIGARLATQGHDVIVYCRNPGQRTTSHRGMTLVNLPAFRTKTMETLSHSVLSAAHAVIKAKPDVAFVFNAANAPVISVLERAGIPVAVNVDGMESLRGKWRGAGARYFSWAERVAVRSATAVIADSRVIQSHLLRQHGVKSDFVPYGIPEAQADLTRLDEVGLVPGGYLLVVARLEPENQVDRIVAAYATSSTDLPLIIVGSSTYPGPYARSITEAVSRDPRVRCLGAIYDQDLLDALYAGAAMYVHGHSVGGTNPSLLRALGAGCPIAVFDCAFSREVLGDVSDAYWSSELELTSLLGRSKNTLHYQCESYAEYDWDVISGQYGQIAERLAAQTGLARESVSDRRGILRKSEVTCPRVGTVVKMQDALGRGTA